jgi:hypothetical protein
VKKVFLVKSAEISRCPCCGSELKVCGRRKRKYIKSYGTKVTLIIRRLRCKACKKIHHELPDILVPYKRYQNECIESAISDVENCTVAAEQSTLYRWRKWFRDLSGYFVDSIVAIKLQQDFKANENLSRSRGTALEGIISLFEHKGQWLAQLVRMLINSKMWIQTRSAFLS